MNQSPVQPLRLLLSLLVIVVCCSTACNKETYPDDGSHNLWVAGVPLQGYSSLFHSVNDGFLWERQGVPSVMAATGHTAIWATSTMEVWVVGGQAYEYGLVLFSSDAGNC